MAQQSLSAAPAPVVAPQSAAAHPIAPQPAAPAGFQGAQPAAATPPNTGFQPAQPAGATSAAAPQNAGFQLIQPAAAPPPNSGFQPARPAAAGVAGQSAPPATRPATSSAEQMLQQMLQPQAQGAQPLQPLPDQIPTDTTSGGGAVAPMATTQPLAIEGRLILDRLGRVTRSFSNPNVTEFTLDADSSGYQDPPMILLPNTALQTLEDQVINSYRDLKIRVSGEVTAYRGRNYLLLSRWSVVPDTVQPLQ
jgi:hypothetical protein